MLSKKLFITAALLISLLFGTELTAQAPLQDASFKVESKPYQELGSWDQVYTYSYYYYYQAIQLPFDFYYDGINCRYIMQLGSGGLKLAPYGYDPYWNYYGLYKDYYYAYWYYDYADRLNYYYWGRYYGAMIYGLWGFYMSYYTWNDPYFCAMKYRVEGNAPNRTAIFQWNNLCFYYGDYPYSYEYHSTRMDFQIKLHEGSNEMEIHYGKMDRDGREICGSCGMWGYTSNVMIGFTKYINGYFDQFNQYSYPGNLGYVNIDPNGNGNMGYGNWEYGMHPSMGPELSRGFGPYETVQDNATFDQIQQGNLIKVSYGPRILLDRPTAGVDLRRNYIYGDGTTDPSGHGNDQHPQMTLDNIAGGATVTKKIDGPISFPIHPSYKVIYDARDNFVGLVNKKFATQTPGAPSNPAFGTAPSGSLDLKTNMANISGGLYRVSNDIIHNSKSYTNSYNFNIASDWDLEIKAVINPKPLTDKVYAATGMIPVRFNFINRGLNEIGAFYIVVKVYNSINEQIYGDSVYWQAQTPGDKLKLSQETIIDCKMWNPQNKPGDYKFTAYAYLAGDQEWMNNYWPWLGSSVTHIVRVSPEIEAEAIQVIEPNNTPSVGVVKDYYVGRPVQPRVRYQNNGINDISDAPTTVVIRHIASNTEVYRKQNIKIPSIPAGITYNVTDHVYDFFTPQFPGDFEITATIEAEDDAVDINNIVRDTFVVKAAMQGTYTIGPNKSTGNFKADSIYNSKNFLTIALAVDKLYLVGVSGPVIFEFTKSSYDEGDVNLLSNDPAIDMRSRIYGVSATNTITFKPSANLSTSEGAVHIHLYSGLGVGFIFGQSLVVNNINSIVNTASASIRKSYANSDGYITFDGGIQKALKFTLHTAASTKWNAVFFLNQGASNITIKGCLITSANPTESWKNYSLPLVNFSAPTYTYQLDTRTISSVKYSYSAGIVLRSITPQDNYFVSGSNQTSFGMQNTSGLDTLVNRKNVFNNNKISGFSYGIVSMGVGTSIVAGTGKHTRFYNKENTISNNLIYNVSRAGIFLGFEENTIVKGNKIFGVANTTSGYNTQTDVAGIMLGGERSGTTLGYNNIGIVLDGNEISNIGQAVGATSSHNNVCGIEIEQPRNSFGTYGFPDIPESIQIKNNAIWGIRSAVADANKVGIALYTERKLGLPDWLTKLLTPQTNNYFTRNDLIANNTILIADDGFAATSGVVAGVAVQNASGLQIYNNAIAMMDNNNPGNSNIYSAIVYQGLLPGTTNYQLTSERNVFWTNSGAPDFPSLYRFIEIDKNSNILNLGVRNEFSTLNQWQMFSRLDFMSSIDNFTTELTTPDINDPVSKLRINSTPTWPVGSNLNNRGENLSSVLVDIDGNPRGQLSQRYDIGAFEFPGILFTTDAEISAVHEPGSYRASSTTFSNAEHIMTEAPVEIKAQLRNNGSLEQSGLKATVKIYREDPKNPGTFYSKPEVVETAIINIPVSETIEVNFNLADGDGNEFYPRAFGDWNKAYEDTDNDPDSLYIVPGWYSTMVNNITPLYRIVVSTQNDEDISNNVFEKVVRFYIKKSMFGILISAENTSYYSGFGASNAVLAGRRNYDSLVAGFKRLGWENKWSIIGEYPVLEQFYDVFERTAWEPRAVDYTLYKTIVWSDADETTLTRFEKEDLTKFIASGKADLKKNLVVGSQEMLRNNFNGDSAWVKNTIFARKYTAYPNNPNGGAVYATQDNPSRYLIGESIGRNLIQSIKKTMISPADPDPIPGLVSLYTDNQGLTRSAYNFNPTTVIGCPNPIQTSAGTATIAIPFNTIYFAVDWRHFGNIEQVLRGVIDFLNKNGGVIIPVELTSFNARSNDNRVEISWETAGEINSSRFEIERADANATGYGSFVKIGEEKAAGKSNQKINYGPVLDKNVVNGNTYAYRLKMVDLNGKYIYSDVVEVTVGDAGSFSLSEAMPNPAASETSIEFTIAENSELQLAIYDLTGKNVMTIVNGAIAPGSYEKRIDVSSFANGYYNIVMNINGMTITRQLRIVR
jgi:hypothetical protein